MHFVVVVRSIESLLYVETVDTSIILCKCYANYVATSLVVGLLVVLKF